MGTEVDLLCLSSKITSHTQAEPSLPFPAPSRYPRTGQKESLLKRSIKTSFCVGGKPPSKPKQLLVPGNPRWQGAADGATSTWSESSTRVTQHGNSAGKPSVAQGEPPSLHKCAKTRVFPLWDYFLNATNSAAKENKNRAMRGGKITANGNQSEYRAWTGQGSSFVMDWGFEITEDGGTRWNRCHRSS